MESPTPSLQVTQTSLLKVSVMSIIVLALRVLCSVRNLDRSPDQVYYVLVGVNVLNQGVILRSRGVSLTRTR